MPVRFGGLTAVDSRRPRAARPANWWASSAPTARARRPSSTPSRAFTPADRRRAPRHQRARTRRRERRISLSAARRGPDLPDAARVRRPVACARTSTSACSSPAARPRRRRPGCGTRRCHSANDRPAPRKPPAASADDAVAAAPARDRHGAGDAAAAPAARRCRGRSDRRRTRGDGAAVPQPARRARARASWIEHAVTDAAAPRRARAGPAPGPHACRRHAGRSDRQCRGDRGLPRR